ncbi:hypothetical protein [Promicromonospora sp. NPDC057488]|uniref:hypothetical protein n=1 Tax=Promicromonospora sp. NPDC057488 TaxID=3346147 RepID=UPI0036728F20
MNAQDDVATHEPPGWWTPAEPWSRGRWSVERRGDEIADVRYDGVLVLRSVRLVVRDDAWRTADLVVGQVRDDADGLSVDVRTAAGGVDVRGTIRVAAAGPRLTVAWAGAPAGDLLTNRTGLVVLHPPHVAGAALEVSHPDASVTRTRFPRAISPHQPARDIAALAWHDGGLDLRLDLRGDVFEMEDQRNWTDASFKTYSRPLTLPFPYLLRAGAPLRQAVEVTASGRAVRARDQDDGPAVVRLRAAGIFPSVITSASTAGGPAPAVPPPGDALLVELDLATTTWPAVLARAADPGLPLDVRLILPDDLPDHHLPAADAVAVTSTAALAQAVAALRALPVARIAAFSPTTHVAGAAEVSALRAALARTGTSAKVLGGVRAHFTELNRCHDLVPADVDGLTFSTTPLFHSGDTEQLVESVAMQRLVAAQAVDLAAGRRPVHVGPVTLRPRFNDVAEPHQDRRADPAHDADPRQSRAELAAWVVAGAAALAVPGVASIAWFEDQGPRGLVGPAGVPRPVAEPVRVLAGLAGRELLSGASPDGRVWALGARDGAGTLVLAANLDRRARTVTVVVDTGHDEPEDGDAATARRVGLRLAPQTWTSVWA